MAVRDPLEPAVPGDPVAGAAGPDGRSALEARLGHRFADPSLLDQALTHRSSPLVQARARRTGRRGAGSNERLEFVGDRVLGLVVAEWLFERFPDEPEGALGPRLAALVSREALAPIGASLGLDRAIRLAPDAADAGVGNLANVVADATEAVLGALYLDGGLAAVRRLVRAEWSLALEGQVRPPKDAKTALQEALAARALAAPVYRVVEQDGPSHAPRFVIEVDGAGQVGRGEAGSKREAEREAAEALLARLPGRRRG